MTTTIHSNGGGKVQDIEALFDRLASHPLDRTFEAYGDFVTVDPVNGRGEPMIGPGGAAFFGNFLTYSHVFRLETDDPELVARLTAAIRSNQQRADYLDQPPHMDTRKLGIAEHWASTTQLEVELIYDGRSLGRFDGAATLAGNGRWRSRYSSQDWQRKAREILTAEHARTRAGTLKAA